MIAVVSYGVCNLGSMLNMLRKINVEACEASTPAAIEKAEKIVLPGIGAFDNGIKALNALGLAEPLRDRVVNGKVPILGVCLGMQLLGTGSEEGVQAGLGLIQGGCVKLRPPEGVGVKIPHMGWNTVHPKKAGPLLEKLDAPRFYFVHSYHLLCKDPTDVLATAHYGMDFTVMVQRGNIYGAQFHPEKSHRYGMTLLGNFAGV
ncbi:MAG: imidazole glycerol phosphate synthase subunit HisH [Gammaproteobacteria bacterium]